MTATATEGKTKVCNRKTHNGVERVFCAAIYTGTECPKKATHVLKIKTGFCGNGFCEGTTPHNSAGTAMPTCQWWQTCACECHERLDAMFKMAEMDRILVDKSAYVPEHTGFNPEDYIKPVSEGAPSNPLVAPPIDPFEAPERVGLPDLRPTLVHRRTDTGRAAKGSLEAQVWEQCVVFAKGKIDAQPKVVSELIADKYNIPLPSTGAIGAVFERWEKLGYATRGHKPLRFTGFTGDGTWEELEKMKAQTKRAAKRSESEQRRGIRR